VLNETNILINDSCIIFDLVDLELLQEFFQLDYSFYTTPQVISEFTDDGQISEIEQCIHQKILKIDPYGALETIQNLYDINPGLSFADCSILELAIRVNGILLTSDKSLRKISMKNNLEIRGILWIIAELIEKEIISTHLAISRLENYHNFNLRIPKTEIRQLIDKLKGLTNIS